MIRELCKHFFQKSLRICKCAGRSVCPAPNRCCLPARPRAWAIFCYALRAAKYRSPCGMRREATPIRGLPTHTPSTVLKTCSGADANLVARQSRALIWGGRSQSSGLTNFPIRLSERSRNLTPLCRVNAGPALVLLFRTSRRTEEAPQRVARSGASDMSEDVLKSNTRAGSNENTDYRSMCDSLIGNGSAK